MITEEKKRKYQQMNQSQLSALLIDSCRHGHLEIVKYLLTSPDLTKHADIHCLNEMALFEACVMGNLDVVKYLLTSPELIEHADMHAKGDKAFRAACSNAHVEIVQYLLTSSDLKEHVNIHMDNDDAFISVCEYKHMNIVNYFIFNYIIEKTPIIESYLNNTNELEIINLFAIRELEKKLQLDLNNKIKKDIKIKL